MRVLIVPEDSRKDKFVLKPLFEALFRSIRKPRTYIKVCEDPILGSVEEVLKSSSIEQIISRYRMIGIFILCVDRDGKTGRRQRLNQIESEFGDSKVILAENAWEEIETWAGPGAGRPFLAAANVGVFPEPRNPAIVPDVFLSLDVQVNPNWWDKRHRSYFVWEFGKVPDLVVEIVSNQKGNEVGEKRLRYAQMGVGYYVIQDLLHRVMREDLRVYRLSGPGYERRERPWFPELGLGMTLWEGEFEGVRHAAGGCAGRTRAAS